MPTPRPHYRERIAHAEGYEIESRGKGTDELWITCERPQWHESAEYRVKPEPKLDMVREWFVDDRHGICPGLKPNLKLTFDGETGALKSAEVIQQS